MTQKQVKSGRPVVIALALIATAVAIAIVSNSFGAAARHAEAFWVPLAPHAFASAACLKGAAVPVGFYDLGPSFRGLHASREIPECLPPRRRGAVDGPRKPTGYVYLTYGHCNFRSGPCRDPLEIQTWAECARNPNSYRSERANTPQVAGLNPHEAITIPSAPELPAAEFEGATRIELYGGGTTEVIFASNITVGRRAASALAQAMLAHAAPASRRRLRVEANEPGDASSCHHLLAAGR